jgi:hypothetical protein
MEDKAIYSAKAVVVIRESCFYPLSSGWTAPEPAELQTMLIKVNWSIDTLVRVLGVSSAAAQKWLSGVNPVPFAIWCILSYQAGYGEIWKGTGIVNKNL